MGLFENMRTAPVSELTLREVVRISPDASIRDVVNTLRAAELGCAVAVDDDNKPCGLFTEAILRMLLAKDPACLDDQVADHLTTAFPWVKLTDSIEMVLDAMETKNFRFVVVVDENGKITGLTGQKGLMEYVAEHFPGEVMVQRIGTKHYPEQREGA